MTSRTEQHHIEHADLAPAIRSRVVAAVRRCLHRISKEAGTELSMPDIRFDLAGTAAGQYRRTCRGQRDHHELRFNPYLLARHPEEGLVATVPHEVAHYAVAVLCERRRTRPHGPEWRDIMRLLGATPEVTHRHDVADLAVRRQRRWLYRCRCRDHELSTTRHNRVQRGTCYLCRACRTPLVAVAPG